MPRIVMSKRTGDLFIRNFKGFKGDARRGQPSIVWRREKIAKGMFARCTATLKFYYYDQASVKKDFVDLGEF